MSTYSGDQTEFAVRSQEIMDSLILFYGIPEKQLTLKCLKLSCIRCF